MKPFDYPLKLECPVQHYAWGRDAENSLIASLLGSENLSSFQSKIFAELWIGAHPSAPANCVLEGASHGLTDLISRFPKEILGERVQQKFKNTLPFLLKVLSIGRPLSIQAHPDKALAKELHKKDPENYPDDNHKPEIAIAVTEVELLAGFRSLPEIFRFLSRRRSLTMLFPTDRLAEGYRVLEISTEMGDRKTGEQRAAEKNLLRKLYSVLMRSPAALLQRATAELSRELQSETDLLPEERWFLRYAPDYPEGDAGLFCFFFLQLVHLAPGECLFTGAGIPHAYLSGELVECMANSDNVVRAGLTPKFKDIETLLRLLTFESSETKPLLPSFPNLRGVPQEDQRKGQSEQLQVFRFEPAVSEFAVEKWLAPGGSHRTLLTTSGIELYLCLRGTGRFITKSHEVSFARGESFVLPAACQEFEIELTDGELYRAYVPES